MEIDNKEIGLFLGGLFTCMVLTRAREIAGGDDAYQRDRGLYLIEAHLEMVSAFPEPLRSRLRGDQSTFVESILRSTDAVDA